MRRKLKRHHNYSRSLTTAVLGMVGALLVVAGVWVFWGYHSRQWDGQTRYTRIFLSPHLVIKSFDPLSNQGVELIFPDGFEIESVSGRGRWMAGVIAKAGKAKWAADSVANYLGISYTGEGADLGWWDELQWKMKSNEINWTKIDVSETTVLEKFTTPDGIVVYHLSRAWDNRANQWFFDQTIESQLLGVVIVNTTGTSGLGASASRVVESMGFKVRSLTSVEETVSKCILKTTTEIKSTLAAQKLQKTFGCTWQESLDQDLTLILGREYRSWKTGD